MKVSGQNHLKKSLAFLLALLLILSAMPLEAAAKAYDPEKDYGDLELRFWEDQQPDIGFYINATSRYVLETVTEPAMGSTFGEWSVMGLLRGMYTGGDYINYIPENYFPDYIDRIEQYVISKDGNLDRNKSTEWSRLILALTALGYDITDVAGYDFIEKLSSSFRFSYRQGINGPIWEIIAMNTGNYQFYEDSENPDVNTFGKMIDYILEREITQNDGTVGGWALWGNIPDPDITGMALQALAPYYLDEDRYNETGATPTYEEFASVVERGVYVLSLMQLPNGGYESWGSINSESIVQIIVALTAMDMDPVAKDGIYLPHIDKTAHFVKEGAVQDGVWTNNMVDALLTFWAEGSGSSPEVGGFRHVTAGYDGGGGSGTGVNAMATDQALYGLIAYDRFLKNENKLYDMTDMVNGEWHDLKAHNYQVEYDSNYQGVINTEDYSPYAVMEVMELDSSNGRTFVSWNSEKDGSGATYYPGEKLSMPNHDITLYAQYEYIDYNITLNTDGGTITGISIPETYTVNDEITLPTEENIKKEDYVFKGWYDNPEFNNEPITIISKGSYGDKTFYAKWEQEAEQPSGEISITTSLKDDIATKADKITFDLWAKDKDGNKISASNVKVTNNGVNVPINWDDLEKTSYTVDLELGANNIVIEVEDNDHTASVSYLIIREEAEDGDVIGTFTFTLEGFTVGLGYLIEPVEIDIIKGENAAQHLDRILRANGYNYEHTGQLTNSFYLAHVTDGENIVYKTEPSIPKPLKEKLEQNGYLYDEKDYWDGSLGEFDFNFASGWMYSVNNVFPNVGFADCYVQDGDVMRVQFTLAYGNDIGGADAMGGGYQNNFFEKVNKSALTAKVAKINGSHEKEDYFSFPAFVEKYDNAMYVLQKVDASQADIDSALQELNSFDLQVENVNRKIDDIGEVTLAKKNQIIETRTAYENLSNKQKELVTNYQVLLEAEQVLETLLNIEQLNSLINELPRQVSKDNYDEIQSIILLILEIEEQGSLSEQQQKVLEANKQEINKIIKVNPELNISIIGGDWYVALDASRILADSKTYQQINGDLAEQYTLHTLYDISPINLVTGEKYQPTNGQALEITMQSPDTKDNEEVYIVHQKQDKSLEIITPTMNADGTMSFSLESFSPVGILIKDISSQPVDDNYEEDKKDEDKKNEDRKDDKKDVDEKDEIAGLIHEEESPKTGDSSKLYLHVILLVLSLLTLAIAFASKKYKVSKG